MSIRSFTQEKPKMTLENLSPLLLFLVIACAMIAYRITPARLVRTLQKMARAAESENNHAWDDLVARKINNPNSCN